jgi:ribosomal protein L37E
MNVKRITCDVCGNNAFHIFKVDDNGIYSQNEHVCTKCGVHYSITEITQEYTALWNEFVATIDSLGDIKSMGV